MTPLPAFSALGARAEPSGSPGMGTSVAGAGRGRCRPPRAGRRGLLADVGQVVARGEGAAQAHHRRVGAEDPLGLVGVGGQEGVERGVEVGDPGDRHVVVLQAQRHVVRPHTPLVIATPRSRRLVEGHVVQPGDVAAVGVVVVDGDHGADRRAAVGAERHGEAGRVLHQHQLERLAVDLDHLAPPEGRGDRAQRGGRGLGVEVGAEQRPAAVAAAVALIMAARPRCWSCSGPTCGPWPNSTANSRSSLSLSSPSSGPGCGGGSRRRTGRPAPAARAAVRRSSCRRRSSARRPGRRRGHGCAQMKESSMLRTTPSVVCSASGTPAAGLWSISANRSSWSRATLRSSACVGLTASANLRAWASSSFEDGHVGLQAPADRKLAEHRGDDAPGEVAAGRVGEHVEAVGPQDRHQHLGRGGLAVGAAPRRRCRAGRPPARASGSRDRPARPPGPAGPTRHPGASTRPGPPCLRPRPLSSSARTNPSAWPQPNPAAPRPTPGGPRGRPRPRQGRAAGCRHSRRPGPRTRARGPPGGRRATW